MTTLSTMLTQAVGRVLQSPMVENFWSNGASPLPAWTPALWFLASEQGIWLDPSDFTRYMSELGPELSQDISFDDTSKWTKGTGWSVSGGQAVHNGAVAEYIKTLFAPEIGKVYAFVIDIAEMPAGAVTTVYCGNSGSSVSFLTAGVYSLSLPTATPTTLMFAIRSSEATGQTTRINSFSIKEVTSASTATLFQDSAGITPVTAVEQSVGKIHDKRKQQDWTSLGTTGWMKTSGDGVVSIVGNQVTITGATTTTVVRPPATRAMVAGLSRLKVNVSAFSATGGLGWIAGVPISITGTGNFYREQSSKNSDYDEISIGTGSITFTIEQYGEWQGNHASQATTASKPKLSARKNLLTYSEDLSNAAWTKGACAITSPSAGVFKITPDSTTALHRAYANAGAHTAGYFFVEVKAAELSKVAIGEGAQTGVHTTFDLASGTVLRGTGKITALSDGWYRIAMKPNGDGTMGAPSNYCVTALPNSVTAGDNPHTFTWLGNSTDGILVRKPHVEALAGSVASLPFPTYQRVTTATDYDTVGFPHYLAFDGVDDFLSTGSIDFTATGKMTVVAGVQSPKTTQGMLLELGASYDSTFPAFVNFVPNTADGKIFAAYHDAVGYGSYTTAAGVAINANVIAYSFDTAATTVTGKFPRFHLNGVNGMTPNASPVAAGAAFINAPLYIGRRAGTSVPFLGNLYQLTVRGANTADLMPGESFTATKTGITL